MSLQFQGITYIHGPRRAVEQELSNRVHPDRPGRPAVFVSAMQHPSKVTQNPELRESAGVILDGDDFTQFIKKHTDLDVNPAQMRHFELYLNETPEENRQHFQMSGGIMNLEVSQSLRGHKRVKKLVDDALLYARNAMNERLMSSWKDAPFKKKRQIDMLSYNSSTQRFERQKL